MTRPMLDTNADFTPRIVGIASGGHNFGLPASLCAAVAPPQSDRPAHVALWINVAAGEIFFVLTLEAWNEMQRQLDAKVKEWAHTDRPTTFPPSNYADSAERQHLVAQLVATTERNDELRKKVKKLTADLDYAKNARKGLLAELEILRAWKEKVMSCILHPE